MYRPHSPWWIGDEDAAPCTGDSTANSSAEVADRRAATSSTASTARCRIGTVHRAVRLPARRAPGRSPRAGSGPPAAASGRTGTPAERASQRPKPRVCRRLLVGPDQRAGADVRVLVLVVRVGVVPVVLVHPPAVAEPDRRGCRRAARPPRWRPRRGTSAGARRRGRGTPPGWWPTAMQHRHQRAATRSRRPATTRDPAGHEQRRA